MKRNEMTGQIEGFRPPREDVNAPDLYIPGIIEDFMLVMAFVSYVILVGLSMGLREKFHPKELGITCSSALIFTTIEIFLIKLGCYILSIGSELTILDILAYTGYKFVGVIVILLLKTLYGGTALVISSFIYVSLTLAFFLVIFF